MRTLVTCVVVCCLAMGATLATAELCKHCQGMMFTADVGKCEKCGADTSSSAKKLCPKCSQKLSQCEACKAPLTPATQPATRPAKR